MTLKNMNVIHEITEIFERMHARLDHRFQQLIRQINSHTNSTNHSHKKSKFNYKIKLIFKNFYFISDDITIVFHPINQIQLEEKINNFGRLTISTTVNHTRLCESVCILLTFDHSLLLFSFLY